MSRHNLTFNSSDVAIINEKAQLLQYERRDGYNGNGNQYECNETFRPLDYRGIKGLFHLNFVEFTDMFNSSTPAMYCREKSGLIYRSYYYIGKLIGTFQISKQYSIKDPLIYVQIDATGKWRVNAVGESFLCSALKRDGVINIAIYNLDSLSARMFVDTKVAFHPYCANEMVDHDEWKGSTVITNLLQNLHVTGGTWDWDSRLWKPRYQIQADTYVKSKNIVLRMNSTSKPIHGELDYRIRETSWQGTIDIRDYSWKTFMEEFVLHYIPYIGISIKGLNKVIIQSIQRMSVSILN